MDRTKTGGEHWMTLVHEKICLTLLILLFFFFLKKLKPVVLDDCSNIIGP